MVLVSGDGMRPADGREARLEPLEEGYLLRVPDRGDAEAPWVFGLVSEAVEVLERLVRLLPRADPRREVAIGRLRRAPASG
ncbi:hypothetical protein [Saccharothrix longispora]|uniref:hypothetical protein n=1 Tax=Saccharothrix longispora TaxID=33920 RepID=UPI0028FD0F2D|nr:hypothetical protein [Saccharothrix longispora]MBY8851101.1 hypothetical protein [Saccharothrix sp. MB29]MDU0290776.1 hypothetical protein [Saccharothrix longispora]